MDSVLHGKNQLTDTASLQSLVEEGGVVCIAGDWLIDTPIIIGPDTRLVGKPFATIRYAGLRTDEPVIACTGASGQSHPWETTTGLERLRINCGWLARGVRMTRCHYGVGPILSRVVLDKPRQLGLDVIDCWCGNVDYLAINECRGVSLRMSRCNSVLWRNVRFKYCYLLWRETNMQPLWEYAATHTIAETRQQFVDTICEDWPLDIPENDRGCIVIGKDQDLTTFDNLVMEPIATGDMPAVSCKSGTTTFRQVRFEAGWHNSTGSLLRIDGNDWTRGTNVTIDGMFLTTNPKGPVGSVVDVRGKTRSVSVRNVAAFKQNLMRSFVHGDTLHQATVADCLGFRDEQAVRPVPMFS